MHVKYDSNGRLKKQPPAVDTGWICSKSGADKRFVRIHGDYTLSVDHIDGKWSATAHHRSRGHVGTISCQSECNAAVMIERCCQIDHKPIKGA